MVGSFVFVVGADTLLVAHAVAPGQEEARLNTLVRVRLSGALLLALAFALFLVAAWRRPRSFLGRLFPLAIAFALLALAPLNAFSSERCVLRPTVYYAEIGGPFTASVGALGAAAAIVLLALLLAAASRAPPAAPWIAVPIVIAILAGRAAGAARAGAGVSPPPGGVAVTLWLGVGDGALSRRGDRCSWGWRRSGARRSARGAGFRRGWRRLFATLAAAIAPVDLRAPGTWPTWYRILWTMHRVAGAHAVASPRSCSWRAPWRRSWRRRSPGARACAGAPRLPTATSPASRGCDPDIVNVLPRFARICSRRPVPRTEADAREALHALGSRGQRISRGPHGMDAGRCCRRRGRARSAPPPVRAVAEVAADARAGGACAAPQHARRSRACFVVLAVPHADSSVTTVVVAPRTRLMPHDPFTPLLGLEDRETGEPPYRWRSWTSSPATRCRRGDAVVPATRTKCTAITSCAPRRGPCARTWRSSSGPSDPAAARRARRDARSRDAACAL